MSKKSPPKTAFYKVTAELTWGEDGAVKPSEALVLEATSTAEALAYATRQWISIEEYPVDKLVAYIKAGGEPIKVPPKAKRPYAKKAAPKPSTPPAAFQDTPAAEPVPN